MKTSTDEIEIYFKNDKLAIYPILKNIKYKWITIPEHMPPPGAEDVKWTTDRLLTWAGYLGENVKKVIEVILNSYKVPQQGFIRCIKLLNMDTEHLDHACEKAIAENQVDYKSIRKYAYESKKTWTPPF